MKIVAEPPAAAALFDYAAAQAYLGGVSRSTFKSLVAKGDLRVVHIGRRTLFRRDDLDAYVERRTSETNNK